MPAILKMKFKWLQTDHTEPKRLCLSKHGCFGQIRMLVFCFLVKERRRTNCCRLYFNTNVLSFQAAWRARLPFSQATAAAAAAESCFRGIREFVGLGESSQTGSKLSNTNAVSVHLVRCELNQWPMSQIYASFHKRKEAFDRRRNMAFNAKVQQSFFSSELCLDLFLCLRFS